MLSTEGEVLKAEELKSKYQTAVSTTTNVMYGKEKRQVEHATIGQSSN